MKLSNSFILLSSALLLQAAGAQDNTTCADFATLSAAEVNCTTTYNCTGLTDPNFGSDCVGNKEEHCAEIEACQDCEGVIRAMFDCEHGAKCGGGLGECHDDDHAAEEAAEAVVIGEEVHDDEGDGDEHSSHDEEESSSHDMMSDSPSSATIRGVVAALAIAIAGGSMILA